MKDCVYCGQRIFGGDACGSCAKFYKKTVNPVEGLAIEIVDLTHAHVKQQVTIDALIEELSLLKKSISELRCELAEVRDTR
jgi:hypothetical protein